MTLYINGSAIPGNGNSWQAGQQQQVRRKPAATAAAICHSKRGCSCQLSNVLTRFCLLCNALAGSRSRKDEADHLPARRHRTAAAGGSGGAQRRAGLSPCGRGQHLLPRRAQRGILGALFLLGLQDSLADRCLHVCSDYARWLDHWLDRHITFLLPARSSAGPPKELACNGHV